MINELLKNETLSDEQLEQVSGGNRFETLRDSKFLYDYGPVSDRHGDFRTGFTWIKKYNLQK